MAPADSSKGELNQLAARAVNGDGTALSSLCQHLAGPVFRLCLRMLGNVRDAEDATQDVLVKVVTHLASFEGRSALMTWVHQIAVRHVLAMKNSRAEERAVDETRFAALIEQGLAYGASQPPLAADDRVLRKEVRLTCTQGMLLMLSRDERLALVLVDLLGFQGAEAAKIAEVSHAALRQRLVRARARLVTFLQTHCGVVNGNAACRCEKQIPAKRSLGLRPDKQRLAPLVAGDIEITNDAHLAAEELKHVQIVARGFHADGMLNAPAALRERLRAILPTVLGDAAS